MGGLLASLSDLVQLSLRFYCAMHPLTNTLDSEQSGTPATISQKQLPLIFTCHFSVPAAFLCPSTPWHRSISLITNMDILTPEHDKLPRRYLVGFHNRARRCLSGPADVICCTFPASLAGSGTSSHLAVLWAEGPRFRCVRRWIRLLCACCNQSSHADQHEACRCSAGCCLQPPTVYSTTALCVTSMPGNH